MMIKGIGVDTVEIERIKVAVIKRKKFVERLFNEDEIMTKPGDKTYYQEIASKFAAKEAVVKAMGTGFRYFKWKDISIFNDKLGKPFVKLDGQACAVSVNLGINGFMISITHTKKYATAFAVTLSDSDRGEK